MGERAPWPAWTGLATRSGQRSSHAAAGSESLSAPQASPRTPGYPALMNVPALPGTPLGQAAVWSLQVGSPSPSLHTRLGYPGPLYSSAATEIYAVKNDAAVGPCPAMNSCEQNNYLPGKPDQCETNSILESESRQVAGCKHCQIGRSICLQFKLCLNQTRRGSKVIA
jgi:hypothetical protein